ncbi:MAG: plastocyanin/azurin family copper-binding protein [Ilumatobacteraceae bacterium]
MEVLMRRLTRSTAAAILMFGLLAGCGSDSKSTADTAAPAGGDVTVAPAADGTPVSVIAADTSDTAQTLTVDPLTVKAGAVTFTFKNTGNRQHEMIVLKTDEAADAMKVAADNKVSEDASVGEIPETDAGKTVTKTFTLAAGAYVLVCNIEKHYTQGMRSAFTVTA